MFVVWYESHMQDGRECGSSIHRTLEEALGRIEKTLNGFARERTEYRLFRLGEEIALTFGEEVKEEVVKHVTRTVKVAGSGKRKGGR
jgi:hypothetical protein